jgi:hypothetical protein
MTRVGIATAGVVIVFVYVVVLHLVLGGGPLGRWLPV